MKNRFLLLLLSIGLAGTIHAAAVNWGNTFDGQIAALPNQGSLEGVVAYLCVGDASVAQQDIEKIKNGTWTASTIGPDGTVVSKTATYYDGVYYIDSSEHSLLDTSISGETSFYVVMFDATGTYFAISEAQLHIPYELPNPVENFLEWGTESLVGTTNGWLQVGGGEDPNVPEPTALALLALGVAGVALRRRIR